MEKRTKTWLAVASFLVLVGGVLFVSEMTMLKWDFSRLSTTRFETNTYEVSGEFDSISINTDTADIVFALSDDGRCRVECHEDESERYSVNVADNTLVVDTDQKSWHFYIGLNFDTPRITVYLPKTDYAALLIDEHTGDIEIPKAFAFKSADITVSTGDVRFSGSASGTLKIKTTTGAIRVADTSAAALDLKVTTGEVTVSGVSCVGNIAIGVTIGDTHLSDTRCKSIMSTGTTGDIRLNNVIASEKLSIQRSTGDVRLDGADAAEILIETDTGDVTGSLLSGKKFAAHSDVGDVDVPGSTEGGRCEVTTDTGDIEIRVK